MTDTESAASVFRPAAASARQAREWLTRVMRGWGYDVEDPLVDDALLCAAELAANAVLHTRSPFEMIASRHDERIRVEVLDDRPGELAMLVPLGGSAVDITSGGTTGRGLQIVAALGRRWGVTTSADTKSVWVELEPGTSAVPKEPVLILGHRMAEPAKPVRLEFIDLPVRAAVGSGMQVDELVRELQMSVHGGSARGDEHRRLDQLLHESASVRLAGRHAALRAAARGRRRFDLHLSTSRDALLATARLAQLLSKLAAELPPGVAELGDDVAAFRGWLDEEGRRQQQGQRPQRCPLPA